jgi:tetratricopeptide (TPR) repeat protein
MVPSSQQLVGARDAWEDILADSQLQAEERFSENLERLPPSCADKLSQLRPEAPTVATLLAAFLAAGRNEPAKTASLLLQQQSGWLHRSGHKGCMALASYAIEHDAMPEASAALELAASFDPLRRPKRLALAALCLLPTNSENRKRYEDLLAQSSSFDETEPLVYVCQALDNPDLIDEAKASFDRRLLDRIQLATDIPALTLLAVKAVKERDESRAIQLYEAGLREAGHSSALMTELARCYLRRSQTAEVQVGDLERAVTLAEKALTQRRKWTLITAESLVVLIRALGLQQQLHNVLRHCLRPPLGTATVYESSDPEVARIGVMTAMQLGQEHLVSQILSSIADEEKLRQIHLELHAGEGLSSDEIVYSATTLLDAMTKPYDYELQARLVMRLALLGVDRTLELRDGVESGAIPSHYPQFIAAVAKVHNNPAESLKDLRMFADVEPTAAELLIDRLVQEGSLEQAITACVKATKRFQNPFFIERHLSILRHAGRLEEAERLAQDALALQRITGATRTSLVTFLAEAAASREEWTDAAALYESVLNQNEDAPESTVWNALRCEANRDQWSAARSLVDQRAVHPQTPADIRLWAQIYNNTGWTADSARTAVSLALKFAEDGELATALLASVITYTKGVSQNDGESTSTGDRRPVVPGEIHRSAFEVLNSLSSRHGDSLSLKRMDSSVLSRPEELRELFSPDRDKAILDLARSVQQAKAPLGILATVLREPYALLLAKRAVGVRVASSPDPDIHDGETAAAMDALNGKVALDPSALELMLDLNNFNELRNEFTEIRVPQSAKRDSIRSCLQARSETATAGSVRWDAVSDRMVFSEADPAEHLRVLNTVEAMNRMLDHCIFVDVTHPYHFLPNLPFEHKDSTWLDTLELAGNEGIPLWSDDLALRSLARSLGIAVFGTVNLVEGIRLAHMMDLEDDPTALAQLAAEQHAFVQSLFRKGVFDQPLTLDDLRKQIIDEKGAPGVTAVALSRPAWWHSQGSIESWIDIRNLVRSLAPGHLRIFQRHSMEGIALSLQGSPQQGALMLAVVALVGYDEYPTVSDSREGLRIAAEVANGLGLDVPVEQVVEAAAILQQNGMLDDAGQFVQELLTEIG